MKAIKYTNYIKIEGLEEHSQAYDKNSFIVKRLDGSSVLFLLEIVSPYEVNLIFNKVNNDDVLIVTINVNNNTGIILTEKPEIIPEPEPEPEHKELAYHFEEEFLVLDTDEILYKEDLSIKMLKYTLERYDDFPDETIKLEIPINENREIIKEIPFEIEYDRIYRITINYKGNIKTVDYIHDKPSCYFSSIYHIKNLASNFDLYINDMKLTEFDLKLLIWKYSKIAVSIAGITGDVIYDHKNALLNDYVGQRALLDIITQAIRETNLTPGISEKTLGTISVTLADLSHGGATTETITTQLIKVHKELYEQIKEMEKNLRNYFAYLQANENPEKQRGKEIIRNNSFNPYIPRKRRYRR